MKEKTKTTEKKNEITSMKRRIVCDISGDDGGGGSWLFCLFTMQIYIIIFISGIE